MSYSDINLDLTLSIKKDLMLVIQCLQHSYEIPVATKIKQQNKLPFLLNLTSKLRKNKITHQVKFRIIVHF